MNNRVQRRAAQILVAWQRQLSVALVRAHVAYIRDKVGLAADQEARGAVGPLGGAGCGALFDLGSEAALRQLGVLGVRRVDPTPQVAP